MAKRKRFKFECGHLDKGSVCNRCKDADKLEAHAAAQLEKMAREARDRQKHLRDLEREA